MGAPGRADRTVTVQRAIDATPDTIFEVLAYPSRHSDLDGSGTLRGEARGPVRLSAGATFSMAMQQGRANYRSLNRVIEFDEGRALAWETVGEFRGRRFVGGHRWRYQLIPQEPAPGQDSTSTLVLHSYDWGAALAAPVIRALGYPRRAVGSMERTLQRLADTISSENDRSGS